MDSLLTPGAEKFRNKISEIEAIKFDGTNADEIIGWAGPAFCFCSPRKPSDPVLLLVVTPEGERPARKGDWVIKGAHGEFYPYDPVLFDAKFEPR